MLSRWALNVITCILTRHRQRENLLERRPCDNLKREREREREMQSHCFVGFEDRGKDHEPRNASYATIEAGKVISLWRECSLANTRFGARESAFRLVTSRNVRENMSTVLTHCACVLSHISQLFATPEEPIGYRSL